MGDPVETPGLGTRTQKEDDTANRKHGRVLTTLLVLPFASPRLLPGGTLASSHPLACK